ncbi:unnamed protein product [Blepharisma stoltei]|uniref:Uncharacterized protein n=1 Tax=Blepharisma stoltei TaxID=1481888 RepID=A0AAU9IKC2_9CILI|nr:unnamed protein product [Blepharisma stoltei]
MNHTFNADKQDFKPYSNLLQDLSPLNPSKSYFKENFILQSFLKQSESEEEEQDNFYLGPSKVEEPLSSRQSLMIKRAKIHCLGLDYLHGENGRDLNLAKAKELLLEAAEMGCTESMYSIGVFYVEGLYGYRDKNVGIDYLQKAAGLGHKKAKKKLRRTGELSPIEVFKLCFDN